MAQEPGPGNRNRGPRSRGMRVALVVGVLLVLGLGAYYLLLEPDPYQDTLERVDPEPGERAPYGTGEPTITGAEAGAPTEGTNPLGDPVPGVEPPSTD